MAQPATIAEFKAQFSRDFAYGADPTKIQDGDITKAFNEADLIFNVGIWISTAEARIAYLYASAHLLVLSIQQAGGLSEGAGVGVNSHGGGVIQQKSVGQVSVSYAISERLQNDPILSQFMRTNYGQKYLQFLTPRLVGAGYVVPGWNANAAEQDS